MTDYYAHVPDEHLAHAGRIIAAGTAAERAAYLTGTVIGNAQGRTFEQTCRKAEDRAADQLAKFRANLGPAPADQPIPRLTNAEVHRSVTGRDLPQQAA